MKQFFKGYAFVGIPYSGFARYALNVEAEHFLNWGVAIALSIGAGLYWKSQAEPADGQ